MTDQNRPEDAVNEERPAEAPRESTARGRTAAGSSAPGGPPTGGPEELPYIDDPVSKWWVAVIIAVFALIFAYAIFFGVGGVFEGILGSDDEPAATAEPTLVASPSPLPTEPVTAEPTEVPAETAEPAETVPPAATPDTTPAPEMTAGPTPRPEATAQPTVAPEATTPPTEGATTDPTSPPAAVPTG